MFSLTNVIHIIVIFQGSLLSLFILSSDKRKTSSNFILGIIIGILSFQILGLFLENRGIGGGLFYRINAVYGFLYGPFLYFFSKSITRKSFGFKQRDLLHFFPFFLTVLIVSFSQNFLSPVYLYIFYALHILSYLSVCLVEVLKYKKAVKDNYTNLDWLNLDWLQGTFLVFTLIVIADVLQFSVFILSGDSYDLENIVFLLILLAINLLYFKGYMSSDKSPALKEEDFDLSSSIQSGRKRAKRMDGLQGYIEKLEQHMKEKESFRNPHLTIAILAEEIGISKRNLSELINEHYQQNFVDFINTHRIELAKYKLQHPKDPGETILEVMYEVGFNSKSSFNQAFKKKTGLTPSQFKNRLK